MMYNEKSNWLVVLLSRKCDPNSLKYELDHKIVPAHQRGGQQQLVNINHISLMQLKMLCEGTFNQAEKGPGLNLGRSTTLQAPAL